MSISNAFDDQTDFEINTIAYEDDGSGPSNINFEYARPSISVDNKGRFVTHEVVGGTTVRQKIGEEPRELSITGVVKGESMAKAIDSLRDAEVGTIVCNRLPGGSMDAQFASMSTSPIEDGGGVAIEDGQFLYTFDMKVIEVNRR